MLGTAALLLLTCSSVERHMICDATGHCFPGPPPAIVQIGEAQLGPAGEHQNAKVTAALAFNGRALTVDASASFDHSDTVTVHDVALTITDTASGTSMAVGGNGNASESLAQSLTLPLAGGATDQASLTVTCSLR